MAFEDTGTGLPVLFIHGFPLSRKIWRPQAAALREEFRAITPDVRGFGESESAAGVYEMDLLADDIAALMRHLQCGPAIMAGHSMGGYVLFAFYRKYPELVRGLILVSTRAVADTAEGKANREALALRVEQEGHQPVVEKMLGPMMAEASVRANPALQKEVEDMMRKSSISGLAGASRGMAARADATDLLVKINVPTLILAGTSDALIHHSESEKMAHAIPNARLRLLEGAGHLPSLEKPEEMNRELKNWLSANRE
jgi:pimeloyl-ACP methyl ester carboxylesterase